MTDNPTATPPEGGMKLPPFDAQEATRSIVRVMHGTEHCGCGFVATERYVITAAHCLPRIPARHFDDVATTIRSWASNDETNLAVIYCDLMSDIAVLGNETLSGTYIPQEWDEAFNRLVARTGSARIDLSFPIETPLRFYIRTHEGMWLTGQTEFLRNPGPMFVAMIDEGKQIPPGTSGSAVFNQKGEVMGLVSEAHGAGVTIVWLAGALQAWHIRELYS